jgi:glyoxylase-like metal-dependent hydrolase (beta-lactamase superfamily II)
VTEALVNRVVVHQLHPGGGLQCTVWLIAAPHGLILVDPGAGEEDAALRANLGRLGFVPEQVTHVLITHCHVDHALGAGGWQRRGARLVASAPGARFLAAAHPFAWCEHPERIPHIQVDLPLADGETLTAAGLSVRGLLTPGHTPDSMTYLLEPVAGERLAFTGDLLMADGRPGWVGKGQYAPDALRASLDRLLALGLTRVYPGHGEPIADVAGWLQRGLARARAGEWPRHSL